jgi:hypothetical protein
MHVDLIRADMLRDASGFASVTLSFGWCRAGTSAVVDVAHDNDDGAAGLQVVVRVLRLVEQAFFYWTTTSRSTFAPIHGDKRGRYRSR